MCVEIIEVRCNRSFFVNIAVIIAKICTFVFS